jgi:hypothetical protein
MDADVSGELAAAALVIPDEVEWLRSTAQKRMHRYPGRSAELLKRG